MIEPEVKVRYLRPFRNKRRGAEGMLPETQAIELAFAKILVIVHDDPPAAYSPLDEPPRLGHWPAPPDCPDVDEVEVSFETCVDPEPNVYVAPSWPAAGE